MAVRDYVKEMIEGARDEERKRCAEIVRCLIVDESLREHVAMAIEIGATMESTAPPSPPVRGGDA